MPTLTSNLFRSRGPSTCALDVIDGHWPTDVEGAVFVVGPDKREPGGHWFAERGIVLRVECRADPAGRVRTTSRAVRTPVLRIRDRFPWLFGTIAFASVSPFGATNLANTNVEAIAGRLFLGYDAGRQVEIDPDTLGYLTPVGGNDEWFQALPGLLEPMVAVAAHPAADHDADEPTLYFVNYTPVPQPSGSPVVFVARWGLDGAIERWPLEGLPAIETVHDIKCSSDHLVFTDLPFAAGPETFVGAPRSAPNQDVTHLFVVAKADLATTPPGRPLPVTTVELPIPTGHVHVDVDEVDGLLTVHLEHIPLTDLMIMLREGERTHNGTVVPRDYEGLITLGVQPGSIGRYRIDPRSGEVVESDVVWDDRFWGSVLATRDRSTAAARARCRQVWFGGVGFDPDLVSEEWWRLYGESDLACLVPPADLPEQAVPGAIARFDMESLKVAEVHHFDDGAFPSPPQFVPRVDAEGPDDGYVFAIVHRDGTKELRVFDAADLSRGPIARAASDGFDPPLLLHSTWLDPARPPRPDYRVPLWRDVLGAWRDLPRHVVSMVRTGRSSGAEMSAAIRASELPVVVPQPGGPDVPIPRSLLERREPTDVDLQVTSGEWPAGLRGELVLTAPHPSTLGGPHPFFGEGLLYRLSLEPGRHGAAPGTFAWRHGLIDSPSARLRRARPDVFEATMIGVQSPFGFLNAANTAPLPWGDRLFATWDVGRPVEVDPLSLGFVGEVGHRDDWQVFEVGAQPLLPLIMSTAHPVIDPERDLLWTTNQLWGRLWIVCWDGQGPIRSWPIAGAEIPQSVHTITQSRDWIVVGDCAYKVEPQVVFGGERTEPANFSAPLHLIRKDELLATPPGTEVGCHRFEVAPEINHYYANWEDSDGVAVLFEHTESADLALAQRDGDVDALGRPVDPALRGLYGFPMSPDRTTLLVFHPETGEVTHRAEQRRPELLWGRQLNAIDWSTEGRTSPTVHHTVHQGFRPEAITQRELALYGDRVDRSLWPSEETLPLVVTSGLPDLGVLSVWELRPDDMPTSPIFVPRDPGASSDHSRYAGSDPGGHDGWVVVPVLNDDGFRVDVFDAADVGRGPLASLGASGFTVPFVLHSAWMPRAVGASADIERLRFSDELERVGELPDDLAEAAMAVARDLDESVPIA